MSLKLRYAFKLLFKLPSEALLFYRVTHYKCISRTVHQEGAALPTFSGVGKSVARQAGESGSLLKRSEDGIIEVLWRTQQQPTSVNLPAGTFPNCGVSKQICGGASVEGPENRIADFFISRPENKSNIPALWFLPLQPVISIVMKKHEGPKRRLVAPHRFYSNYVRGFFGASKITNWS